LGQGFGPSKARTILPRSGDRRIRTCVHHRPTAYWDGTAASELQVARRPRSASAAISVWFWLDAKNRRLSFVVCLQTLALLRLPGTAKTPSARALSSNAPVLGFKGAPGGAWRAGKKRRGSDHRGLRSPVFLDRTHLRYLQHAHQARYRLLSAL
jgi:hypothetical protein